MKTCPVCQSTAFEDAIICFGCLSRFENHPVTSGISNAISADIQASAPAMEAIPDASTKIITASASLSDASATESVSVTEDTDSVIATAPVTSTSTSLSGIPVVASEPSNLEVVTPSVAQMATEVPLSSLFSIQGNESLESRGVKQDGIAENSLLENQRQTVECLEKSEKNLGDEYMIQQEKEHAACPTCSQTFIQQQKAEVSDLFPSTISIQIDLGDYVKMLQLNPQCQ